MSSVLSSEVSLRKFSINKEIKYKDMYAIRGDKNSYDKLGQFNFENILLAIGGIRILSKILLIY